MLKLKSALADVIELATSGDGDLLRVVLNARSYAEADLALGLLRADVPERLLVAAVNVREAIAELPSTPCILAVDMDTLGRIGGFERVKNAYTRRIDDREGDYSLTVLGQGNLCYDVVLQQGDETVFWTPSSGTLDLICPGALELVLTRVTLLHQMIDLARDMGLPFSPRFYMSLDDWLLETAERAMSELQQFFYAGTDEQQGRRPPSRRIDADIDWRD